MKITWGFLTGLTIGVGLGMAFAPQSGEDVRKFVGQKTQEGLDQVAGSTKEAYGRVKDAAAKSKDRVAGALDAGREGLSSAKQKIEEMI